MRACSWGWYLARNGGRRFQAHSQAHSPAVYPRGMISSSASWERVGGEGSKSGSLARQRPIFAATAEALHDGFNLA